MKKRIRICALHDDLLVRILLFVPTKDAVATTILSKRWRYVWTMLPVLEFKEEGKESIGWFTDKSLQLHKAPILDKLGIELGPSCPVDVDVSKWVDKAVNQCVKKLKFKILWNAEPTSFPKSLYTCDTLVYLELFNEILVDVCFAACLPSLLHLRLYYVVYKDEDSLPMLLSGCPVLKSLRVLRCKDDNLKQFTVKVPSLRKLVYVMEVDRDRDGDDDPIRSLVIDSPALTCLKLLDFRGDFLLIENMPCLNVVYLYTVNNPDHMFLRSLSMSSRGQGTAIDLDQIHGCVL